MEHEENIKKKLVATLGTLVMLLIYVLEAKTFGVHITRTFLEMSTIGVILGTAVFTLRLLALVSVAVAFVKSRYDKAFETLVTVLIIDSAILLELLLLQDEYALLRSLAFLTLVLSIGIGIIFNFKLIAISAFISTIYVLSTNLPLLFAIVLLLFALIKMKYKTKCKQAAILFVTSLAVSITAAERFNLTKWSLWLPFILLARDMLKDNKLSCEYGNNLKNNILDLLIQFVTITYSVLGGLPPDNVLIDLPTLATMLVIMASYTLIYSLLGKEGAQKNP